MYNSFLHQRQVTETLLREQDKRNTTFWKNKYYSDRDKLIKKYDKRVQAFIYRMEEQPMQIANPDSQFYPFRQTNKQSFLAKERFVFKELDDWRSIYNPLERLQRKRNSENLSRSKDINFELMNRSLLSQSKYQGFMPKDQYRSRSKDKQIHQIPMRFNYQPPRRLVKISPKLIENESKLVVNEEEQELKRGNTNSSIYSDQLTEGSKISKVINQKNQQKQIKSPRKNPKKPKVPTPNRIKTQIKQEKVFKSEPNSSQMKSHFKAVMDLVIRNKQTNKNAKDVLRKCHFLKQKKGEDQMQKDLLFDLYRNEQG